MKNRRRREQRHMAYCDVHVTHNVPFAPVLAFQRRFDPTHIVINGDFLNLELASHWNEAAFKHYGYDRINEGLTEEFDAGHDLLAEIRAASPHARIQYVPGNHEHWLYWMALHHPAAGVSLINQAPRKKKESRFRTDLALRSHHQLKWILERKLRTAELDIEVLPYNEPLAIGRITYLHGHQFTSPNATPRMYPNTNLVLGHFHTHEVRTLHNNGQDGKAIQHVVVPCLTELGPGYLTNRSTRWLNGFWIADVARSGLFDGRVKKLLDGRLVP